MDTCYYVLLILPLSVKFAVVLVTLHLLFLSISCVSCITSLVGSTTKAFIHACHKHSDDHSMHTFFSNFRIRMKVVLLKRHVNTLPTLTVFLFGMTEYWTKNKKYLLTCTIVLTKNCKTKMYKYSIFHILIVSLLFRRTHKNFSHFLFCCVWT